MGEKRGGSEDNSKIFYLISQQKTDGSNGGSQNMFYWRNMDNSFQKLLSFFQHSNISVFGYRVMKHLKS